MAKYQITVHKYKSIHLAKSNDLYNKMTKSVYMPYSQNVLKSSVPKGQFDSVMRLLTISNPEIVWRHNKN
ncbi:Genetic interactor of prohibitins 3, mitochondrial [Gossypium arboreum]|uniref:Genetic interactor of prohibitins 3, mitochondrial n=1 Tax=Gossypium arboreum TaxID=29729 RepID=A0A0B0P1S7_GOSAR|nr:Genetic interactor of prohibitins 3, mitochondrial [Gossypium arboreum]KHG21551.1 Genetic interactor of prohibitins 3, mitochondrial [Gossypium arboreum]